MQETPTQSQISGLRPQSTEGGRVELGSLGGVDRSLGGQLAFNAQRVPDLWRA